MKRFSIDEAIRFGWNTVRANLGLMVGLTIVVNALSGAGGALPGKVQATLQYVQEIITGIDSAAERTGEEAISGNWALGLPLRQALVLRRPEPRREP